MITTFHRFRETLLASGLPLNPNIPAIHKLDCDRSNWPNSTWHAKGGQLIRLDWLSQPTPDQINQAQTIIDNFDPAPVFEERLADLNFQQKKTLAACNEILWAGRNGQPAPAWAVAQMNDVHQKISGV